MEPDGALLQLHPRAQYPRVRALHGLSRQVPYVASACSHGPLKHRPGSPECNLDLWPAPDRRFPSATETSGLTASSCSASSGKSPLELSPSRPREGRWPSSRTLGGMRWTLWLSQDERSLRRTAKPCGPDAPTLASSLAGSDCREATVARKPGHRGERGISRKPLRREGRSVSANLWRLRSCAFFLHARLWVRRAPGFPCALHFLRVILNDNSGAIRAARTWAHIPP